MPQSKPGLKIAEQFYSVQGESVTAGTPAVFLRLTACNLLCHFCDTIEVWKQGERFTNEEIVKHWSNEGWLKRLRLPGTNLVITGGEPMLQADGIVDLLVYLNGRHGIRPYTEIETNGTILPSPLLSAMVNQYNVSPKTENSGADRDKRYNEEAFEYFKRDALSGGKTYFKYVVSEEEDVNSIIPMFNMTEFTRLIQSGRIFLMPEADCQEQMAENSEMVMDLCKKHGFRFSSRLQIVAWNKTTGV